MEIKTTMITISEPQSNDADGKNVQNSILHTYVTLMRPHNYNVWGFWS